MLQIVISDVALVRTSGPGAGPYTSSAVLYFTSNLVIHEHLDVINHSMHFCFDSVHFVEKAHTQHGLAMEGPTNS